MSLSLQDLPNIAIRKILLYLFKNDRKYGGKNFIEVVPKAITTLIALYFDICKNHQNSYEDYQIRNLSRYLFKINLLQFYYDSNGDYKSSDYCYSNRQTVKNEGEFKQIIQDNKNKDVIFEYIFISNSWSNRGGAYGHHEDIDCYYHGNYVVNYKYIIDAM